ncbi:MAG: isopentenyl phosphate kinase [Halobacteria archaeon]|nr:isopentenyl phosphate kinase [Halobacteria archaeon]
MILKIGGSVLTSKSEEETLDQESFDRALDAVADTTQPTDDLILVHGAGSFGHPHAERHGLGKGSHTGVYETHRAVSGLNKKVVEGLRQRGLGAVPVHPFSCSLRKGSKFGNSDMMTSQIGTMVVEGFLPVLHGDCVVHSGKGVSIISGDEIAVKLARRLDIERVGMCTSTGGILDSSGEIVDRIGHISEVEAFGTDEPDVTGGIRNKVEEILDLASGGYIFGLDDISGFLNGEDVGTLVRRTSKHKNGKSEGV